MSMRSSSLILLLTTLLALFIGQPLLVHGQPSAPKQVKQGVTKGKAVTQTKGVTKDSVSEKKGKGKVTKGATKDAVLETKDKSTGVKGAATKDAGLEKKGKSGGSELFKKKMGDKGDTKKGDKGDKKKNGGKEKKDKTGKGKGVKGGKFKNRGPLDVKSDANNPPTNPLCDCKMYDASTCVKCLKSSGCNLQCANKCCTNSHTVTHQAKDVIHQAKHDAKQPKKHHFVEHHSRCRGRGCSMSYSMSMSFRYHNHGDGRYRGRNHSMSHGMSMRYGGPRHHGRRHVSPFNQFVRRGLHADAEE